MFYTLIKHWFLTNQNARRVLSKLLNEIKNNSRRHGLSLSFWTLFDMGSFVKDLKL